MPTSRATLVRNYDPKYLHEITIRTNNGVFAFDPNDQGLKSLVLGLLHEAARTYGVSIIGIQFMTNHYHGLFGIASAARFCKFLMYFHGCVASLAHVRLGTGGKFWSENKWVPVAQDEVSVSRRLRYILGQAVKAGLVEHPVQFPGISSTDFMIDGKPLVGLVFDRTRRYRDSQLKAGTKPEEAYTTRVEVPISPPPCWAHLSPGELQQRYRQIADEVARTPLHVLRGTRLLASPQPEPPDLTQRQLSDKEEEILETVDDKVRIPVRETETGKPHEQGRPNAKKRGDKRRRMPYLLSSNLLEVLAYEESYLQLCEAYAAAKRRWHARASTGHDGLVAPRFKLPPHTLVGTMPLVD